MNAPAFLATAPVRQADLQSLADRSKIEAFVRASEGGEVFHLPQWLAAVEAGCGQKARYLVAEGSLGDIVGILPLTEVRSALFGSALVSSGFAVSGGLIAPDAKAAAALVEAAQSLATELGCPTIELRGGDPPAGFQRTEGVYAGFARELPTDEEEMLKAVPRKQRAEIRRAMGNGLTVETGSGIRDREAHYRVYSESVRNLGTPVFPRRLFNAMLDRFGEEADILTIRKDGRAVASVLSFYFRGTVLPYWGGGTIEARGLRANELLYFALMRHAAARGCSRFDFGRSKIGTGAYSYKKNWGFEPQPLSYALWTADGAVPRAINPMDKRYRMQVAMWRRLPLPLANRIGPLIARGLG